MADFIGIHWYKCDLHLHTAASECYLDKEDTAAAWVARAKEQGLDCAAVTDHNDYRNIDPYLEEGKKQGLSIFPGVEITCDSTKIHLLILFDTHKNGSTVRDFLSKCDIDSEHVGDPDGTPLSAFEVCRIAKARGAMVIAAHIDEFSSISSMNPANLEKILSPEYLDAVQVKNRPVWDRYAKEKDPEAMYRTLKDAYGQDATPETCERWRKCYERALAAGIPMIAASDNPRSASESKHGLWGIGTQYTWIKMNDVVDLESIRQSLFSPDTRIRMCFDSVLMPYEEPDFWIRSVEYRKTSLNPYQPIRLDFSPQLNCIIGGRGSGKSAVVKLLSGAYRCLAGSGLSGCCSEMERFYSRSSEEAGTGVFLPDSEIEILLRGFGKDFRLLITDIRNEREQEQRLFSAAPSEGGPVWEEISDPFYAEFFRPEVCIENQIYETARTPGVLLRFVDRSVPEIQEKLRERDLLKERVLSLRMELRTLEHELADEQRKETARAVCLERLGAAAGRACALLPGFSEILFSFIEKPDDKKRRASFSSAMEELRVHGFRTEKLEKLLEEHRRLSERASRTQELRASIEKLSSRSRETLQAFGEKRKELTALRNAYVRDVLGEGENIRFEVTPAADPKSLTELMEHASAEEAVILPEDQLHAFFRPNGAKKFFPMTAASSGERAVAVLTFLLAQGSVPLIMDQPEDDLDNRLVYELVVRDLKKIKETRQLILVTHNANIPVNADAELIISMDPWAKYTKVRMSGTMDEEDIRHEICDVLEGTDEAFSRRARKYHL